MVPASRLPPGVAEAHFQQQQQTATQQASLVPAAAYADAAPPPAHTLPPQSPGSTAAAGAAEPTFPSSSAAGPALPVRKKAARVKLGYGNSEPDLAPGASYDDPQVGGRAAGGHAWHSPAP